MKPHKLKQMIKLIEQEGTNQLLLLLLEYNEPLVPKTLHITTVKEFTEHLRKQLPNTKDPQQDDIESAIKRVKNGEY